MLRKFSIEGINQTISDFLVGTTTGKSRLSKSPLLVKLSAVCKRQAMAIKSPRYSFNPVTISTAPKHQGVFWLWDEDELIFVGRTTGNATIRSCLTEHCAGDYGPCTQQATHYGWELARFPAGREAELVEDFAAEYKRLPRCHAAAA